MSASPPNTPPSASQVPLLSVSHTPSATDTPVLPPPLNLGTPPPSSQPQSQASEILARRLHRSASAQMTASASTHALQPQLLGLSTPRPSGPSHADFNVNLNGPSTSARTRSASVTFDNNQEYELGYQRPRTPPNPAKYLRLASTISGLTPDQVTKAASVAQMTPRSVRVMYLGHLMAGKNTAAKLQAHVAAAQKYWEIPKKLKSRIAIHAGLGILTPLPRAYKHELIRVIYQLLKDSQYLPDDIDKHDKWEHDVTTEIGSALSHARFAIKAEVLASLNAADKKTPVDVFTLTEQIAGKLGVKKQLNVTRNVLQAVAYIRGTIEEQNLEDKDSVGRNMWDLLDIRVRTTRDDIAGAQPRQEHMEGWLMSDIGIHGAIPAAAKVKDAATSLQHTITEAVQSDTYGHNI